MPELNNNEDREDLKTCPFCGSDKIEIASVAVAFDGFRTWALCGQCGVTTRRRSYQHPGEEENSKRSSAHDWNRRVDR